MSENRKQSAKPKKKRSLRRMLLPIFVCGFVACVIILWKDNQTKKKADDTYDQMQDSVNADITTEAIENITSISPDEIIVPNSVVDEEIDIEKEYGIVVPEKNLDWDALHVENDDIYAWIYIPGTAIDYPILQHKTEQDFYLDHNLDGSAGYPGCIYTQIRNSKSFDDFATIIYGHDMLNGTMFQNLHNYEDSEFFASNPYIFIYTPEKTYVYKIFSAVTFHDRNILMYYDMSQTSERARYINDIKACTAMTDQHDDMVTVNTECKIVSLSTCIGSKPDNRWIVSGVLLN